MFILLLQLHCLVMPPGQVGHLHLQITNIKEATGVIRVGGRDTTPNLRTSLPG